MSVLGFEARQAIRAEIDRRRRRELEPVARALAGVVFCAGCGMEMDEWTPGCRSCWDRWYSRRRRGAVSEQRYRELQAAARAWRQAQARSWGEQVGAAKGWKPRSTWRQHREALGMNEWKAGQR